MGKTPGSRPSSSMRSILLWGTLVRCRKPLPCACWIQEHSSVSFAPVAVVHQRVVTGAESFSAQTAKPAGFPAEAANCQPVPVACAYSRSLFSSYHPSHGLYPSLHFVALCCFLRSSHVPRFCRGSENRQNLVLSVEINFLRIPAFILKIRITSL